MTVLPDAAGAPAVVPAAPAAFNVWLLADEAAPETAAVEHAIGLLAGRIVRRGPVDQAPAFDEYTGRAIVVLLLDGQEVVADVIDRTAAACTARDWKLIVSVAADGIDAASGVLAASPDTQLVCEPTDTDWVTALAIALAYHAPEALGERWREREADRLARLNDEVARIAEVLTRLSRPDRDPAARVDDRRATFTPQPGAADARITAAEVRDVIRARRLRDRFFAARLLEDPGWDMILDLFAAHLERGQVSVSSLCIAAAVAPTTALRWITKLSEAGLLEREPDPFDKRRAFVALSPTALEAMRRYVAALREQRLSMP